MKRQSVVDISATFALGAMATVVATAVATFLAFLIAFPMSLFALIIFPVLIVVALLAAVLVAPVTLFALPLTYQLTRGRSILTHLVIPIVGLVAGGAIASFWIAIGILPRTPSSFEIFSAIGMISGLSGGAFFVRGLYA